MATSIVSFRRIWTALPLLLSMAGCGVSPTSSHDDVASDPHLSSHAGGGWESTASATFYEIHDCWEIDARIVVSEASGRDGAATLDLIYSVFGICGGEEGLWYYDLTTEGVVPIDPEDFSINPGLQRASVDTEVPVFDFETAERAPLRVQATWVRSRGGRDRPVVATLDISAPYLPRPPPTTEPLTSFEADLTRSRR